MIKIAANKIFCPVRRACMVAEALGAGRFLTTQRPGGTETSMHGHEQIYAAIVDDHAEAAPQCANTSGSSSATFTAVCVHRRMTTRYVIHNR